MPLTNAASLFGHNAPDFRTLPSEVKSAFTSSTTASEWPNFEIQSPANRRIDLDREYTTVLTDSWVVLEQGTLRELYRVERNTTQSRTDFTLTGKVSRLKLDTDESLDKFDLRGTVVLAASRLLPKADAPILAAVVGDRITLDGVFPTLDAGKDLFLSGRVLTEARVAPRAHVFRSGAQSVEASDPALSLTLEDGSTQVLEDGAVLTLLGPRSIDAADIETWPVATQDGTEGTVVAEMGQDLLPIDPLPEEDAFAPPDPALYSNELISVPRR